MAPTRGADDAGGLGAFIRSRRDDILRDWEHQVRRMPVAGSLSSPTLLDHLPELLDRIGQMVDALARGQSPGMPDDLAQIHALERLGEGFDLTQVVSEFSILRDCVLRMWEQSSLDGSQVGELRIINQAIDSAVSASVDRFTRARDRTLLALDRIASQALESRDLGDLLERLLQVFVETTAAVDTAAVLIRDGDQLRVRAARGLDERALGFTIRIGEGFAGTIAAERRAVALHGGEVERLVKNPSLRTRGVKVLYGVPLIDDGEVIGVAHMGSASAADFSTQDRRLFGVMVNRAAAAVNQHVLRERADRAASELSAVLESIPAAIYVSRGGEVVKANRAGLELLGLRDAYELRERPIASLATELTMRDAATGRPLTPAQGPLQAGGRGEVLAHDAIVRDRSLRRDRIVHSITAPIERGGVITGAVSINVDVTARREVEQALRERELEFRTLADNIPQLAWIADNRGEIYWYNQRWFDYTGTSLEAVAGWGWQRVHHPDHLERVVGSYRQAIESGRPWEDVFPLRGTDGGFRWFLSRAVPVRDDAGHIVKWFGTNTDVTEQRFLSTATAVLAHTLDINESLEHAARLAVPELADWCGVHITDGDQVSRVALIHSDPARAAAVRAITDDAGRLPAGLAAVIRTGQPVFAPEVDDAQVAALAGSGRVDEVRRLGVRSIIIVPLVARGRILGALSLGQAESGRRFRRADLELASELGRRAGLALDNARLYGEAQDALHARDEILAIVSHDLRSPLGNIEVGAQLALDSGDCGPRSRRLVETVARSVRRMDRLLRDLLDTAALQVGRLRLERRPEEASGLVDEAISGFDEVARKKGITLARRCQLDGVTVDADRERLIQALGNLLGNAIKFCSSGDRVTVLGDSLEGEVRVAVEDSGPGIPPAELPRIFEPYWSARRHATRGTGLGLYICKGIVESHGGRIEVATELGRGTTFTLVLPRHHR